MEKKARWGEVIDGRPLYKYRLPELHVDILESFLHPAAKASDEQRVLALAPVAVVRFATNYRDGIPCWEDCGEAVAALYGHAQGQQIAFRRLAERSFRYYEVDLIRGAGGARYLETVISQAGIPAGMLRDGSVIRRMLDELMEHAVLGSGDLLATAKNLVDQRTDDNLPPNQALRRAYKAAGHLPTLCVEIVQAVTGLVRDANWSTGDSLDRLWGIPEWERRLPFLVPVDTAKEVVRNLLGVALRAAGESETRVQRVLLSTPQGWLPTVQVSAPDEGIELDAGGAHAEVLSTHFTFDGKPAEEAFRLKRRPGGRYVRSGRVTRLPMNVALGNREISLALMNGSIVSPFPCQAAEALEAGGIWVFAPVSHGQHAFRAHAPVRLRAPTLLALVPSTAAVVGDAQPLDHVVEAFDGQRRLWQVSGTAEFKLEEGDPVRVTSGHQGPERSLMLVGRHLQGVRFPGFSTVFIGCPDVRQSHSLDGRQGKVEWRRQGAGEWQSVSTRGLTGLLSFRLLDDAGEVHAERRRILVLPDGFRAQATQDKVRITCPPGLSIADVAPRNGDGIVELRFDGASSLQVGMEVSGSRIVAVFDAPVRQSFIDIASGQVTTRRDQSRVTTQSLQRVEARSVNPRDVLYLSRPHQRLEEHLPLPLQNGSLQFVHSVRNLIDGLSFDTRGRTQPIRADFLNGPGLHIDPYRLKREGNSIRVDGPDPEVRLELWSLVPGQDPVPLKKCAHDECRWDLPSGDLFHLAVDIGSQASPCFISEGDCIASGEDEFARALSTLNESARLSALEAFYDGVLDSPGTTGLDQVTKDWSEWIARFGPWHLWLDPFLVLSQSPDRAVRMLLLTHCMGHGQAYEALSWHVEKVPFFWHRVTPPLLRSLMSWASMHFGAQGIPQALQMLRQFTIPRALLLQEMDGREQRDEKIHRWQQAVLAWHGANLIDRQVRTPALADNISMAMADAKEAASVDAPVLPLNVPSDIDVARTLLNTPFELALAVQSGYEISQGHWDSVLYARHLIDLDAFDGAFCASLLSLDEVPHIELR